MTGLPRLFRKQWAEVDSNHRSNLQQIYSLSPLATRESAHDRTYIMQCPDRMIFYHIIPIISSVFSSKLKNIPSISSPKHFSPTPSLISPPIFSATSPSLSHASPDNTAASGNTRFLSLQSTGALSPVTVSRLQSGRSVLSVPHRHD